MPLETFGNGANGTAWNWGKMALFAGFELSK